MLCLSCRAATRISRRVQVQKVSTFRGIGNRDFTASLRSNASKPRKSPAVAAHGKYKKASTGVSGNGHSHLGSIEDALPPIAFLKSAKLAGALDIEPEQALDVIRRYHELAKTGRKNWEHIFCLGT
jgi:hypothetical protein